MMTGQEKDFQERSPKCKPILQYDLEGNFIKEFPSIKEAAEAVGVKASLISLCKSKRLKSTGGFQWRGKNDVTPGTETDNIGPVVYSRVVPSKAVLQFNKFGIFIKEHPSISEAARTLGLSVNNIVRCTKKKGATAGGFQWRYKGDPQFEKGVVNIGAIHKKSRTRPVCQFGMSGNFIMEFESVLEAAKRAHLNPNQIASCAEGIADSIDGFQWRYKDDPIFAEGIKDIEPLTEKEPTPAMPVIQFNLKGDCINDYPSIEDAASMNCIPVDDIKNCADRQVKTAGKYQWRYKPQQ